MLNFLVLVFIYLWKNGSQQQVFAPFPDNFRESVNILQHSLIKPSNHGILSSSPSSWRLQINNGHGDNQRVLLSQWLQGQNSQARPQVDGVERSLQTNEASPPLPDSPSQDVAVDLSPPSNEEAAGNRVNGPQPAAPNAPAQGGSNNNNNPFAAIQLLLEQNPEMYNIFQTCLSYIPFILLIFLNEIYKHTSGNYLFIFL